MANYENISPIKLIDYDKNAKNHPKEQIKKLARAFKEEGFHGCIIADENLVIIAGHGRKYAAIEAGLSEVPVQILSGLTEEQKRSKRLGDNKLGESDWLDDLLKSELKFLNESGYDVTLSGFDLSFIEENKPENTNDPEDCPDVETVELRCNLGELWELGDHRMLVGSATNPADVHLLMENNLAHLIVTDPPYNVDIGGKEEHLIKFRPNKRKDGHLKNDKMSSDNFYDFLSSAFKNYKDFSLDGAAIYVFYADLEAINFRTAMIDNGFLYKQNLVWLKSHIVLGRQDYQWKHEPIMYGWKEGAAHNWYSDRKQTTILEFNKPQRNAEHPTMKPIELIEYLINNSSKKGDLVIDFFGGSGSTLIACEKTGRICRTIELDPKYASVIVERWEKYSGKQAKKAD